MILLAFIVATLKTCVAFYSFFENETRIVYPPTIITFIAVLLAWYQHNSLGLVMTAIFGGTWVVAMAIVGFRDDGVRTK